MDQMFYQPSPKVVLATNTFINVPTILQYDDTPLISLVRDQALGFTTEIPIFHPDGTYLAKVNGTRIFATEDGKKAGLEIAALPQLTVCKMAGKVVFEIRHQPGDAFRAAAELYTPTGYFVKCVDHPAIELRNQGGEALKVSGIIMSGNVFSGCRIGVWVRSDGSTLIGVS